MIYMYTMQLTKEYLQREYIDNARSASNISNDIGRSITYVLKKIRDFGFEVRPKRFYYKMRGGIPSRLKYRHILTREFLEEEYIKNERSANSISTEIGCADTTVREYIRRHGISMRDKSFYHQGERNPIWGKPRSDETKKKISESKMGNIPWNKGLNKEKNESLARISANLVGKKRLDITLEKHPNWRGGTSLEPYSIDFDEELKEKIRERDEYRCRICGKHTDEQRYKLSIHHIDYDKLNMEESNLVSLCSVCHTVTNFNRDAWQAYFQKLLENEACEELKLWL